MAGLDEPILFLATADAARSRNFYESVLGLSCLADEPYALVFKVGAVTLRIQKVRAVAEVAYTVLGWSVEDIRKTVKALSQKGVEFVRYEHLQQDADGVWESPGGASIVWFKDPDGSTLSLTQS